MAGVINKRRSPVVVMICLIRNNQTHLTVTSNSQLTSGQPVTNSQDIRNVQLKRQKQPQHKQTTYNISRQSHTLKPCTPQRLQNRNVSGTSLMTHQTSKPQYIRHQQKKIPSTYYDRNSQSKIEQSKSLIAQSQMRNSSFCNNDSSVSLTNANMRYSDHYLHNFRTLVSLPPKQPVNKSPVLYNYCTRLSVTADLINSPSNVLSDNCTQSQLCDNTFDRSSPIVMLLHIYSNAIPH